MSSKIVGVRPAIAAKYSLNVAPAALIHKKVKGTRSKRPPMTRAERRRRRVQRQTQDAAIKVRMAKLRRLVREECTQLGKDYKRKPRYFTDMFFQGGARIRKPANKASPFNTFISQKSREARADSYLRSSVDGTPQQLARRSKLSQLQAAILQYIPELIKNLANQTDALKKELTQLIQEALDKACSTTNQAMHYERFDTLITLRYGVVCEGWPKELPFQKPSAFGGNNESLFQLRDAWRDGAAVFRRLNNEELAAWKAARSKGIEDGTIVPKARKKRRDAGTRRGPKGKGKGKTIESGDEDSQDEASGEESDEGGTPGSTPPNASLVVKNKPAKPV
ncbi:hypothetical protein PQX77_002973 [Marasmius sp. AFHP31]|nr:hypothetical protein PQX77_002973 [Marasmius sp. AFHP31]